MYSAAEQDVTPEMEILYMLSERVITVLHHKIHSCVKTFLLSSENDPQNVPLPDPNLHYDVIFQSAIPQTC